MPASHVQFNEQTQWDEDDEGWRREFPGLKAAASVCPSMRADSFVVTSGRFRSGPPLKLLVTVHSTGAAVASVRQRILASMECFVPSALSSTWWAFRRAALSATLRLRKKPCVAAAGHFQVGPRPRLRGDFLAGAALRWPTFMIE